MYFSIAPKTMPFNMTSVIFVNENENGEKR